MKHGILVCTALLTLSTVGASEALGQQCCPELELAIADRLEPDEPDARERLGHSIAADGDVVVVGAPSFAPGVLSTVGRVIVFTFDGFLWSDVEIRNPDPQENDRFGWSVDISGDLIVVGAPGDNSSRGKAHVFELEVEWEERSELVATDGLPFDQFGVSVGVESNSGRVVVGAPEGLDGGNTAYVFKRDGDTWEEEDIFAGGRSYGTSVSIFSDGTDKWIAVGDPDAGMHRQGEVEIFKFDSGIEEWDLLQTLAPNTQNIEDKTFGISVEIGKDLLVVGAGDHNEGGELRSGAAYIFRYNVTSNVWSEEARIISCNPEFNGKFGSNVTLSDGATELVLIGAENEDVDGVTDAGAGYVFRFDDPVDEIANWVLLDRLVLDTRLTNDEVARDVAIASSHVVLTSANYKASDGGVFPLTNDFSTSVKCCKADLNNNLAVDFADILAILTAWGNVGGDEDLDDSGTVDFGDILFVLARWGPCPGSTIPGIGSFADALACMGLTDDNWDDFAECLSNAPTADDDNCICWMEHYYYCHCAGSCPGFPNCSGADPFATHPH